MAAPRLGGYDLKFDSEPPDALVCLICTFVARDPQQMDCCGRVYCQVCLSEHKKHSNKCPHCREAGNSFVDRRGDREIKALKVLCNKLNEGCLWTGELRCLEQHFRVCEYELVLCTNECSKQGGEVTTLLRKDLKDHLTDKCPRRQYECPHCKETGEYQERVGEHLDMCPDLLIHCPNNGCRVTLLRKLTSKHIQTCYYTLVPCTNACETDKLLRKDLQDHLTNKCQRRQYECPHCKETGEYQERVGKHLETCTCVRIACSNVGCQQVLPRFKHNAHREHKCDYGPVPCKYADVGCEERPLRKDLKEHERNNGLHLLIAIERIREQKKDMEEQKIEIEQQREEIRQQREDIKQQQIHIEQQKKDIEQQKKVYQQQQTDINLQKRAYEEHRRDTENLKNKVSQLTFTFKVPTFNAKKESDDIFFSPPFYSSKNGYTLCISVYANGRRNSKGTHVSVYARLMKGEYDDSLTWPFTGTVTIELLNQLEDKNHHKRTATFPADDGGRVVNGEKADSGHGYQKFISHADLVHQPDKNCHYLKNDTLVFRVSAEAPDHKPWLEC